MFTLPQFRRLVAAPDVRHASPPLGACQIRRPNQDDQQMHGDNFKRQQIIGADDLLLVADRLHVRRADADAQKSLADRRAIG